jgi:hypothetical protein
MTRSGPCQECKRLNDQIDFLVVEKQYWEHKYKDLQTRYRNEIETARALVERQLYNIPNN